MSGPERGKATLWRRAFFLAVADDVWRGICRSVETACGTPSHCTPLQSAEYVAAALIGFGCFVALLVTLWQLWRSKELQF